MKKKTVFGLITSVAAAAFLFTGVSKAKGYTDIDTGVEWLLRVAESRKIDIKTIGLRRTDDDR